VRIVETSRSPKTVIATVRGIGVAVSTSTCGAVPFARRVSRCSTPKRCCSSTTTSRGRRTSSTLSRACVPDDARLSRCRTQRRLAPLGGGQLPVSSVGISSGRARSQHPRDRADVLRREHLGRAMSADWPPDCATCSIARRATSVLPEPTSP
jgi:hypothetical protein